MKINPSLLLPAPTPLQVRDSRRESGLSQAAMATALGLSAPARIAEYENGKRTMSRARWSMWMQISGQTEARDIDEIYRMLDCH